MADACKGVLQCNDKGDVLQRFSSVREAAKSTGVARSYISYACKHHHWACGYKWYYAGDGGETEKGKWQWMKR